jgi:hypothetical protein
VANAVDRREDFQQLRLFGAAVAEVLVDRAAIGSTLSRQQALELGQKLLALFEGGVGVPLVGLALQVEYALRLALDGADAPDLCVCAMKALLPSGPRAAGWRQRLERHLLVEKRCSSKSGAPYRRCAQATGGGRAIKESKR